MKNDTQRVKKQMQDYADFCREFGIENQADDLIARNASISREISILMGKLYYENGKGEKGHTPLFPFELLQLPSIQKYQEVVEFYKNGIPEETAGEINVKVNDFTVRFKAINQGALLGAIENYFDSGNNKMFLEIYVPALYPTVMEKFDLTAKTDLLISKYFRRFAGYMYGAVNTKDSKMYDVSIASHIVHISSLLMFSLLSTLEEMAEIIQVDTDTILIVPYVEVKAIKDTIREWSDTVRNIKALYLPFKGIYQKKVKEYVIIYEDDSYRASGMNKNSGLKGNKMFTI